MNKITKDAVIDSIANRELEDYGKNNLRYQIYDKVLSFFRDNNFEIPSPKNTTGGWYAKYMIFSIICVKCDATLKTKIMTMQFGSANKKNNNYLIKATLKGLQHEQN